MNRMSFYAVLLALLLCGGCDTGTVQRLNCICLIDYSGSLAEETLHLYVETIRSDVLRRLGEKDRLVVLPIDEGAKTEAVKLVSHDLAEMQFLYHSDGYAHAKDSLRMRLRRFADRTGPEVASQLLQEKGLRQKYTYKSDIFAAIEQAAGLMEQNQEETFWQSVQRFVTGRKRIESSNVLLIFSDMIQESDEVSFTGPEGCTQGLADSTLANLQTSNRIPNLTDCTVFVNGRTGKTNGQVENVKSFWIRYFKQAHAGLGAYDYDARSQITSFLARRLGASG
jgi:hypothetical protein